MFSFLTTKLTGGNETKRNRRPVQQNDADPESDAPTGDRQGPGDSHGGRVPAGGRL